MRQWFLGWRSVLQMVDSWSRGAGLGDRWLCPPTDVLCMFDKEACQRVLERGQIPVAPMLGLPRNFDELWELMRSSGRRRVFLKPCHGSAASGVVALEASRNDIQAFSTVELVRTQEGWRMYNRRRINTWRGAKAVREMIDAVCGQRCLAQIWVPKAGLQGKPFDVRIVVIGGKARHVMVRLGRGPMTNSQLLGGKGDVELLRSRMGESSWAAMLEMCEQAMSRCFPRSLYAGFDVLVEPGFHRSRVLEVNAFGDLLPRQLHDGRDTYEWEVLEAMKRPWVAPNATSPQNSNSRRP
jgi:glutathione synthase/RimK-type ligase-like ATP-grasp enzyme